MFGFSLSELIVVIVVALVVIGPKDLPKMLRKLGQYAAKLRRMASDLRSQSGIDDALRTEGLADDIAEIRKLARGELDSVQRAVAVDRSLLTGRPAEPPATYAPPASPGNDFQVHREREYPRDGADALGALPDNAIVYTEGLPKSKLARDPIYALGDPDGVVPEPEPAPEPAATAPEAPPNPAATAAEASEAPPDASAPEAPQPSSASSASSEAT